MSERTAPVPTDMPCMAMTGDRRTRTGFRAAQGHDHLLATGPECNDAWPTSTPAPTHADDVAALRDEISMLGSDPGFDMVAERMTAALDRIAARAPQRATDLGQSPWYLHTCGAVALGDVEGAPDGCPSRECFLPGRWHALYVLLDGA